MTDHIENVEADETPTVAEILAQANDDAAGDGHEGPKFETIEDLAREMNWNPDGEKSAAEFILAGESIRKRQRVSNEKLDKQIQQLQDTVSRMSRNYESVMERAEQQAMRKLQADIRQAVEDGDVERYETLRKQESESRRPAIDPEVQAFADRNPWMASDPVLKADALNIDAALIQSNPNMSTAERLRKVEAEVKARNPHKFQTRAHVPDTDTRPPGVKQQSRKRGWDELPREAVDIGEKLVKQGLYTREDWANKWWSDK